MNRGNNILYIDDQHEQFGIFSENIQSLGEKIPICASSLDDDNVEKLIKDGIDIAFIDYYLDDDIKGTAIAKELKEKHELCGHKIPIHFILLTGQGSEKVAKDVIRSGLFQDYINKGVNIKDEIGRSLLHFETIRKKDEEVFQAIKQAEKAENELLKITSERDKYLSLVENVTPDIIFETGRELIGSSEVIVNLKKWIDLYSRCDEPVLIIGPSGSGKELVARAIHHNHSKRKKESFIPVNCAALPGNLIESELFGYVKGAFTGALSEGQTGKFEAANNGTLFLDEIGDLSLSAQAKILRVLQEGEITKLGSNEPKKVDVRLICATNKDLKELIKEKEFREDLFYRISGFFPKMKSLSEHKDDINLLVEHFATQCREELTKTNHWLNKPKPIFEPDAVSLLVDKEWQGNIRELQKFIRQLIFLFQSEIPFDKAKVERFYKHWKELNPNFEFHTHPENINLINIETTEKERLAPDEALISALSSDFDIWEIEYQKIKNERAKCKTR